MLWHTFISRVPSVLLRLRHLQHFSTWDETVNMRGVGTRQVTSSVSAAEHLSLPSWLHHPGAQSSELLDMQHDCCMKHTIYNDELCQMMVILCQMMVILLDVICNSLKPSAAFSLAFSLVLMLPCLGTLPCLVIHALECSACMYTSITYLLATPH